MHGHVTVAVLDGRIEHGGRHGDATLLVETDLSAAGAKAKGVREQLRALEETLSVLTTDVSDTSSVAAGRLMRARVSVTRAIEEIRCTDTAQTPF